MLEDKKFYLTEKGLIRLKAEYQHLRKIKSFKTEGEVPRFLHSEDLNPEYLSFHEDLDLIDTRLAEVKQILRNVELIKMPSKDRRSVINLGATVIVEVEGENDEFQIVGSLEANPSTGRISNESPVGRALLGHKVGDNVIISSPLNVVYRIKKVKYNLS
jgi:transcription elongation factor GreA